MAETATGTSGRSPSLPGPPARRPRRQALRDIAFITFIEVYFFVFILALPFTSTGYEGQGLVRESVSVAVDLGSAALSAAGWGIGVLVTALLGFFAITVGGNFLYRESDDLNLQMRSLALIAELAASAAVFCALLITTFCLSAPETLGQLLFVVPTVMVIVFVAVEVGVYLAPEPEKVIANSFAMRVWARAKIVKIGPQPPRGLFTTLVANSLAIAFGATAIAMPANTWISAGGTYAVLLVATALMASICTAVRTTSYATRDRFSVVLAWVTLALIYLLVAVGVIALVAGGAVRFGVILAFIAIMCLASTWVPRRGPLRSLYEWSLVGGATADAIRTLRKTASRAAENISKSEAAIERRAELIDRDTPRHFMP